MVPVPTVLLLVDDDIQQLDVLGLVLKMSGFSVLSFSAPSEALSNLARLPGHQFDIAIVDYEMPAMNGWVLAHYLRACYPEIKIILHSGAVELPDNELRSVDAFVPKGEGITNLLLQVSHLRAVQLASAGSADVPVSAATNDGSMRHGILEENAPQAPSILG